MLPTKPPCSSVILPNLLSAFLLDLMFVLLLLVLRASPTLLSQHGQFLFLDFPVQNNYFPNLRTF